MFCWNNKKNITKKEKYCAAVTTQSKNPLLQHTFCISTFTDKRNLTVSRPWGTLTLQQGIDLAENASVCFWLKSSQQTRDGRKQSTHSHDHGWIYLLSWQSKQIFGAPSLLIYITTPRNKKYLIISGNHYVTVLSIAICASVQSIKIECNSFFWERWTVPLIGSGVVAILPILGYIISLIVSQIRFVAFRLTARRGHLSIILTHTKELVRMPV